MKPVVLDPPQWEDLKQQLTQDYPASTMLIRSKKRAVLGFTERHHRRRVPGVPDSVGYYQAEVDLDFFADAKQTFFIHKYGDRLEKGGPNELKRVYELYSK